MFYNRRKVALFLPMYVIGGIIAFNLLKILLNVTEIKNYYTNHIIFLEISIVLGIVFFLSLIGLCFVLLMWVFVFVWFGFCYVLLFLFF